MRKFELGLDLDLDLEGRFRLAARNAILCPVYGGSVQSVVFDFFRRRRLSEEGEKRLVVSLARAEEAIIEAHVECALDVIEAVGAEMPIDRVLEVYLEALEENPQRAEIVARRVLSRLNYAGD